MAFSQLFKTLINVLSNSISEAGFVSEKPRIPQSLFLPLTWLSVHLSDGTFYAAAGIWFWIGLFGGSWLTFMILVSDHTRWCLITWAERESALHDK